MPEPKSDASVLFGRRVQERRDHLGLSQETAATLSEMHVSNFGKIERGLANPSLHTILKVATALNIDAGELLTGLDADMLPYRQHTMTAAEWIAATKGRA
jgi:transcriptional regulator with XRE-family HTH domain